MRKFVEPDVADNPLYHDTWKLLKKYRDVVWSLELSVQHVRTKFEIEYGTSIEDFLDSVYLAGADLAGSDIEHHACLLYTSVSGSATVNSAPCGVSIGLTERIRSSLTRTARTVSGSVGISKIGRAHV